MYKFSLSPSCTRFTGRTHAYNNNNNNNTLRGVSIYARVHTRTIPKKRHKFILYIIYYTCVCVYTNVQIDEFWGLDTYYNIYIYTYTRIKTCRYR